MDINTDKLLSDDLVGRPVYFEYGERKTKVGKVTGAQASYEGVQLLLDISNERLEKFLVSSPRALDFRISV